MFPPSPLETINWNALGLSITDAVNGHVESTFSLSTGVWSTPTFVADPFLRVHGLSPALNYGQQAYEGLKAHRSPSNSILLFRPADHAARLSDSAAYVSIPPIPEQHFLQCVKLAVAKNAEWVAPHASEALLYIRPLVFGSSGHLALTAPTEFTFAVFVQPGTTYHGVQPLPAVVVEDFDRAAPRGTGGAKVGGNYAPVIRWTDRARSQGYGVTLHLDAQTRTCVEEFSTSGFIGVKKAGEHVTLVVPDSKNIVASITSDSCLALAESFGWKVERREITWSECKFFDEVVAVGTAASLLPIRSLHRPSTGETFGYGATTGEVTARLGSAMRDLMRGKSVDGFGWIVEVKEEDLLAEAGVKPEIEAEVFQAVESVVLETVEPVVVATVAPAKGDAVESINEKVDAVKHINVLGASKEVAVEA